MASISSSRKANGVLPVTTNQNANGTAKSSKGKAPAQGKKVIIRRLPPGLTADEFWNILGDGWKPGKGKVDWARFDEGEISSNDQLNPSLPARCYLHVIRTEDIPVLAELVQKRTWEDAKRTFNDPALVGPPYLENAAYQKIPTTKHRADPRQGSIDQDPDFMAFLSSLTMADVTSKESSAEQTVEDAGKADVKVTSTPLVDYIKEKKANKAKEAANIKSGKHARHESQGSKVKEDSKKKGKDAKTEKPEKSGDKEKEKSKEPVKVQLLTKKAAAQEVAEIAKSVAHNISSSKSAEEATPKSRRAGIAAAAKILQRDLGLSPGSAHRRARQDAAKAEAVVKPDSGKEKDKENRDTVAAGSASQSPSTSAVPPSTPTGPKAQAGEGSRRSRGGKATKQNAVSEVSKRKGNEPSSSSSAAKSSPIVAPVILKRKDEASPPGPTPSAATPTPSITPTPPTGPKTTTSKAATSSKPAQSQKKGSSQPLVTVGATRAFVKHANPSQGVTEPLLKQAMEAFGSVTFVEIDKRKGFAYVDFGDHDALLKAVTASPITVAQGTVQVLERKEAKKAVPASPAPSPPEKAPAEAQSDRSKRGGRRGRRGGGGGGGPINANGSTGAASTETQLPSASTPTSNAAPDPS